MKAQTGRLASKSVQIMLAIGQRSGMRLMNANGKNTSARYGIDVRGFKYHAEAIDLEQAGALLEGVTGAVSIVDRQTRTIRCYGSVAEAIQAIGRAGATSGKGDPDGGQ